MLPGIFLMVTVRMVRRHFGRLPLLRGRGGGIVNGGRTTARSVLNISGLVAAANAAPCPACRVIEEIRYAASMGAMSKAATIRKSPAVRAAMIHKCERGTAGQ